MPNHKVELHAGGIVFRRARGGPHVLIVTARGSRKRWILPKGKVKRGERPSAAALREVKEEGGVTGRVVEAAGAAQYRTRDRRVRVEYFLIEYLRPVRVPEEDRKREWCAVEDAMQKLTFASARKMLLSAHERLLRRSRPR